MSKSYEFKRNTFNAFIALSETLTAGDDTLMEKAAEAAARINECFADGSISVTASDVLNKIRPALYRYGVKANELKLSPIATFRRYIREDLPQLSAAIVIPETVAPKAPKAPKAKKAPAIENLGLTPAQLEQLKAWMAAANHTAA